MPATITYNHYNFKITQRLLTISPGNLTYSNLKI
jgi:hypothetical protein